MLLRACVLAVVAVAGCAAAQRQILQSPAAGGPEWRELGSEHFVVRTDYPDWAARSALETFDRSARALVALTRPPAAPPPHERVEVVLFEHQDDLQALAGDRASGQFRPSLDGGRPTLLLCTDGGFVATFDLTRITMQHELTHWIFHNAVPGLPKWLDEGLARYWESLRLEDGQAIIGSIPPMMDLLADWPSTDELFAADGKNFYGKGGHRYYSAAWGTVYLLYAKHADAFTRYLAALAGGLRGEAAWRSAFGSFGARELDAERRDWFSADRPWAHTVPLAVPPRDMQPGHPLPPAEVHVLWARLRSWGDDKELARVAEDLATAERLAPASPLVQAWQARLELRRGDTTAALARLDRALREHPADRALVRVRGDVLLHAELARPPAARDFAPLSSLAEQLTGDDAPASALRFAARVAAFAGDAVRSVALAERSTARAPDCAACFDTLAVARAQAGDVDGAVRAEETALRLLPDGADDHELTQRLAELKQKRKRSGEVRPAER